MEIKLKLEVDSKLKELALALTADSIDYEKLLYDVYLTREYEGVSRDTKIRFASDWNLIVVKNWPQYVINLYSKDCKRTIKMHVIFKSFYISLTKNLFFKVICYYNKETDTLWIDDEC